MNKEAVIVHGWICEARACCVFESFDTPAGVKKSLKLLNWDG